MSIVFATFSFARETTNIDRAKAKIYAKYHAHELHGDTKNNRLRNCVDEEKEEMLINSIVRDTNLWWDKGIGICEDNICFTGKEKVIRHNGKLYITMPELELSTNINSGMNRVFNSRKEIKKALGDKFLNLPRVLKNKFTEFWIKYPNGIVIIGNIDKIRRTLFE